MIPEPKTITILSFGADSSRFAQRNSTQQKGIWISASGGKEPEQEKCGITHYAGCACHELGWENKWKAAVELAARAEMERDELRAIIYEVSTGGYTPMAAHEWLKSHPENVQEHLTADGAVGSHTQPTN